LIDIGIY